MKKLLQFSLALVLIFTGLIFTGCKDEYSVYIFTSSGGSISINEDNDHIYTKDILYYSKETTIRLEAHADTGYEFKHWLVDSEIYSTDLIVNITVDSETVIKAIFDIKTSTDPLPEEPEDTTPEEPEDTTPEDPEAPDTPGDEPTNPDEDDTEQPEDTPSTDPDDDTENFNPDNYHLISFIIDTIDLNQNVEVVSNQQDIVINPNTLSYYILKGQDFTFYINYSNLHSQTKIVVSSDEGDLISNQSTYTLNNIDGHIIISVKQVLTFNLSYGTIEGYLFEDYIGYIPPYMFESYLSYGDIKDETDGWTTFTNYLKADIIQYAHSLLNHNADPYRVSSITISDGTNTASLKVNYSSELNTTTIELTSGTITPSILLGTITLNWEYYGD